MRTSFNTDSDVYLPKAQGCILVVTAVGDQIVLPAKKQAAFLPLDAGQLAEKLKDTQSGVARKRLDDGTRVVLLYAKDTTVMLGLIDTVTLWPRS